MTAYRLSNSEKRQPQKAAVLVPQPGIGVYPQQAMLANDTRAVRPFDSVACDEQFSRSGGALR